MVIIFQYKQSKTMGICLQVQISIYKLPILYVHAQLDYDTNTSNGVRLACTIVSLTTAAACMVETQTFWSQCVDTTHSVNVQFLSNGADSSCLLENQSRPILPPEVNQLFNWANHIYPNFRHAVPDIYVYLYTAHILWSYNAFICMVVQRL